MSSHGKPRARASRAGSNMESTGAANVSDDTVRSTLEQYESLSSRVNSMLASSQLGRTPTGRLPLLCVTSNSAVELRVLEHLRQQQEAERAQRLKEAHASWVAWRRRKDKALREEKAGVSSTSHDGESRGKRQTAEEAHEAWVKWRAEKDEQIRKQKLERKRAAREKKRQEEDAKLHHDQQVEKMFHTFSKLPTKKSEIVRSVPPGRKLAKLSALSANPLTKPMSKTEQGWAPSDRQARAALARGNLSASQGALPQQHSPQRRRRRSRTRRHVGDGRVGSRSQRRTSASDGPVSSAEVSPRRDLAHTSPSRLSPIGMPRGQSPFAVPLKIGAKPAPSAVPARDRRAQPGAKSKRRKRHHTFSPERPSWNFDTKAVSVVEEIRLKEAMRAEARRKLAESKQAPAQNRLAMYDINGRPNRKPSKMQRKQNSQTSPSSGRSGQV